MNRLFLIIALISSFIFTGCIELEPYDYSRTTRTTTTTTVETETVYTEEPVYYEDPYAEMIISDYFDSIYNYEALRGTYECDCFWDLYGYNSLYECIIDLEDYLADEPEFMACADFVHDTMIYSAPAEALDYFACVMDAIDLSSDCYAEALEYGVCSDYDDYLIESCEIETDLAIEQCQWIMEDDYFTYDWLVEYFDELDYQCM